MSNGAQSFRWKNIVLIKNICQIKGYGLRKLIGELGEFPDEGRKRSGLDTVIIKLVKSGCPGSLWQNFLGNDGQSLNLTNRWRSCVQRGRLSNWWCYHTNLVAESVDSRSRSTLVFVFVFVFVTNLTLVQTSIQFYYINSSGSTWRVCVTAWSSVGTSVEWGLGYTTHGLHAWERVLAMSTLRLPARRRHHEPICTDCVASEHGRQTASWRRHSAVAALSGKTGRYSTHSRVLRTSQGGTQLPPVWHL